MFTALFIACLLILSYYAISDLHDSVVIAKRFDPEARIGRIPNLAYRFIQTVKN